MRANPPRSWGATLRVAIWATSFSVQAVADPSDDVTLDEVDLTEEGLDGSGDEPLQEPADGGGRERVVDSSRLRVVNEHRPGAAFYRLDEEHTWAAAQWEGGRINGQVEIDIGYASYEYPESKVRPRESLHDMRGRFVLGPMFQRTLSNGLQLTVLGQLVAWVREQEQSYQINVDDVYARIGSDQWDLQVGRFFTWRVYQKGLGFDIFTLEDQGANRSYPISNGAFAVHTYEVDYMYLRNSPYVGGEVAGRAALHYYPLDSLGFELAAAYGLAGSGAMNTSGARMAMDFHWGFLQVLAGAEYRQQKQTGPLVAVAMADTPLETLTECELCLSSNNLGFGGSVILSIAPVRVGGAVARGVDEAFNNAGDDNGKPGPDNVNSGKRLSLGGFGELDVGSMLFDGSLIVGAGYNRTELIRNNNDQQFHYQGAAYIAYPLGVNDAMAKLVASRSTADLFESNQDATGFDADFHPRSATIRFRISSNF